MKHTCIACGKELELDNQAETENAHIVPNVWGAVVFRSSGQYGSRVIDEIPEAFGRYPRRELQIMVCDQCILERSSKSVDLVVDHRTTATARYGDFDEEYEQEFRDVIVEQLKKDGSYRE